MSGHHPPQAGFSGHQQHQQANNLAQQQAYLAQYANANGGQAPYGSIPPHLLQQGFRQPQAQPSWPDTSNGAFAQPQPPSQPTFNSPSSSQQQQQQQQFANNGMSPYAGYGTPQQGGSHQQPPHRSHSSLAQQANFMGSPTPNPMYAAQNNPSGSTSGFAQQQAQMLPPQSTASPRPSSKRKHRASTGPGAAPSPLTSSASIPSPANQARQNPMAMGGYDPSALANAFPGAGGSMGGLPGGGQQSQHANLQAAFMAQRLQAQQQQQAASSPQSFQQGSPYAGIPHPKAPAQGSMYASPSASVNGGPGGGSQSMPKHHRLPSGVNLPAPNPALPDFFPLSSLPAQYQPYANNPGALQLLYKDQPDLLTTIAKMMIASKRQGEGYPGYPGSAIDSHGRRTSFGMSSVSTPSANMAMPSKSSRSGSSSSHPNHSTPSATNGPPPGFYPNSGHLARNLAPPSTPTPASFASQQQQQAPLGLPVPPSRLPSRPSSPLEWTGSIHPSTLPATFVQPLVPSTVELTDPTFAGALPEVSKAEIKHVQEWMAKDKKYLAQVAEQRELVKSKLAKAGRGIGRKTQPGWWEGDGGKRRADWEGDRAGLEAFSVVWPDAKKARREEKRGRKEVRFTKAQMRQIASQQEHLVPIRLEIDYDPFKFRDTFTWNASDPLVTPDMFAQTLIDDFHLPSHFRLKIVTSINEQVTEYQDLLARSTRTAALETATSTRGTLDETDTHWWATVRHDGRTLSRHEAAAKMLANGVSVGSTVKGKGRIVVDSDEDETETDLSDTDRPMTVAELGPKSLAEFAHDEMRITIKIDITVGRVNLTDSFEWDANGPDSAVEEFAEILSADLGLPGEFKTAIAHDIREQCFSYLKSLILVGHPFDGTSILDEELRLAFLPPVTSAIRTEDLSNASFTPMLQELDDADIEKAEKERERELKRKKRQTKGRRGVALPEREPNKTKRTVPSLGRPGPTDSSGLPIPAPGPPGSAMPVASAPETLPKTSRRAAALAASVHIASIAKEDYNDDYEAPRRSASPPSDRERKRSGHLSGAGSSSSVLPSSTPVHSHQTSSVYNNGHPPPPPPPQPHPSQAHQQQQQQQQQPGPYSTSTPLANRTSNGHPPHPPYPPQQQQHGQPPYGQGYPSHLQQPPAPFQPPRQQQPQHQPPLSHQQQPPQHQPPPQPQQQPPHQYQPPRHSQAGPPHPSLPTPAPSAANSAAPAPAGQAQPTPGGTRSRTGTGSGSPAQVSPALSTERPRRGTRTASDLDLPVHDAASLPTGLVQAEDAKANAAKRDGDADDGGSPLSFHDVASPDSSSELSATPGLGNKDLPSDDVPAPPPAPTALPSPPHQPPTLPLVSPSLDIPASASPTMSTSSAPGAPQPPAWLVAAADALRRKHPDDSFNVVTKARKSSVPAPAAPEWRIKCLDCPGKIYDPGAGPLLDNFTVHLNNRNHRAAVNARKEKEKERVGA